MRLYRMELYKLYHKKIFLMGILSVIGLMLLYFCLVEVGDEIAVVGSSSYSGYEAVQINREITKEFEGVITNEKINQVVENYGMPSKIVENISGWRDGNYLNDFVVRYFTNGSWESGTLPSERYTLEESGLSKVSENIGMMPVLEYTKGWGAFVEMLQLGLVLGSVLVICCISTVFAEEGQTKMLALIFTTEEGKRKDILAKVLAAFTVTFFIFVGIILFDFLLCNSVYGLDGFTNMTGIVLGNKMLRAAYQLQFSKYFSRLILFGLQALMLLCATTLCVSASYNGSFTAVIISTICWVIPILLRMLFRGLISIVFYAAPIFLVMQSTVDDVYMFWEVVLLISLLIGITCTLTSFWRYKTKEA